MRADLERFMENNRWTNPKSPLSYLQCKAIHLNGVQTRLKCKPNVKRCKRFVFPSHSPLLHHNALTTKAISHFQADHILTRFVFPPLISHIIISQCPTGNVNRYWHFFRSEADKSLGLPPARPWRNPVISHNAGQNECRKKCNTFVKSNSHKTQRPISTSARTTLIFPLVGPTRIIKTT